MCTTTITAITATGIHTTRVFSFCVYVRRHGSGVEAEADGPGAAVAHATFDTV